MSNATDHPSRWLSAIPLIVSAGALFVFFSGFYVHGFSLGLGVDVHHHLTVSDYAGIAMEVGTDPRVFFPVLLIVRLLTLMQEVQGTPEERPPAGPPSARRPGRMLATVIGLTAAVIVLLLLLWQHSPQTLWLVLSLLIAILAVAAVVFGTAAMLRSVRPANRDHDEGRDEWAVRTRSMRIAGWLGVGLTALSFWALGLVSIHPELDRFQVLDLLVVPGLLLGMPMAWVFVIDSSYGYKPLRGFSSDHLRTVLSVVPFVLFVYGVIGFHDGRELRRGDTGSVTVLTTTSGDMEVDSYRNFETWLLATAGGIDDTRFTWIPVRATRGVALQRVE